MPSQPFRILPVCTQHPGRNWHLGTGTPRRWHPISSGSTSVWRQPFTSADLQSKQRASRASEALPTVHVNTQGMNRTQQHKGWISLLQGQCLQVHHLALDGSGGNFVINLGLGESPDVQIPGTFHAYLGTRPCSQTLCKQHQPNHRRTYGGAVRWSTGAQHGRHSVPE